MIFNKFQLIIENVFKRGRVPDDSLLEMGYVHCLSYVMQNLSPD